MRVVLIIASDPAVASLHRARLEADGFRVEVAGTASAGLAIARERPPVAVVAEIDLPDFNGAQLATELRQLGGGRSLPLLLLSNTYLPLATDAALKAGATHCLDKTAGTPDAVAQLINEAVPAVELSPAESGSGAVAISGMEIIRRTYLARAEAKLNRLRADFVDARQQTLPAILSALAAMPAPLETLASTAGAVGHRWLSQLASALSALAYHLTVEPERAKPSPLRTVGAALDALVSLCKSGPLHGAPGAASPLVLAVDDLAVTRDAIQRLLTRAEINVITLHSPRLALDVFRQNCFDLVLLDLLMPEMSGFDLCKEIRAFPHGREVPVIFVTGIDDFEARAQAKIHGGTDFIAKPFLPAELTTKVFLHLLPEGF